MRAQIAELRAMVQDRLAPIGTPDVVAGVPDHSEPADPNAGLAAALAGASPDPGPASSHFVVPGEPEESWGTMPLDKMLALLQATTTSLAKAHETCAMDEAAYHRKYWTHWQELDSSLSVAVR